MTWSRPVPLIGDPTSAAERASDPAGWAFPEADRHVFYEVVHARRDIRRFRPDAVPDEVLARVLAAAHAAPSVGHSQPWRFVVVTDAATRHHAASMADRERLVQAAALEPIAARHLLDLQLEGIREAPIGVVVACDRRVPAQGVLGRGTFQEADLWSCACAIQNLWLAARAEGLGLGWVTFFVPDELSAMLHLPDQVVPLGWLCLGWPDERPPDPGLERAGWSKRLDVDEVVRRDRWAPDPSAPAVPHSKLRVPDQAAVVEARDDADSLLTPLGSLGVLDRAVDRVSALGHRHLTGGTLVLAAGRHPVAEFGVSAFGSEVTDEVVAAASAGEALGPTAAVASGLGWSVHDAGASTGNLSDADAMPVGRVLALLEEGRAIGRRAGAEGLVALGEVGIGNTTVAAALTVALLGVAVEDAVGLGAAADTDMVARKREVVARATVRLRASHGQAPLGPIEALAGVGGPEFALLAGVTLGAAERGAVVVLDGLATSIAALAASRLDPGVAAHLVAGQRSREAAHPAVLEALGLEPLLDLRLRAGEGVGAVLASALLLSGLAIRRHAGRTSQGSAIG